MQRFILIIDEDFDTRGMLYDWLNAMGFDPVAARNGDHGLALMTALGSIGCPIDGILLNFEIPRVDSLTVLHNIQELFPEVPVIITTSVPNTPRVAEALKQGARDFVVKPFDRVQFQEKCFQHFKPRSE